MRDQTFGPAQQRTKFQNHSPKPTLIRTANAALPMTHPHKCGRVADCRRSGRTGSRDLRSLCVSSSQEHASTELHNRSPTEQPMKKDDWSQRTRPACNNEQSTAIDQETSNIVKIEQNWPKIGGPWAAVGKNHQNRPKSIKQLQKSIRIN